MMKKQTARLLTLCLSAQLMALPVHAADAQVENIDGVATVFVSNFGRMSFGGKNYTAYKNFNEALAALGKDGGKVVFTAEAPLSNFNDTENRGSLTFLGVGKKPSGNTLDFSGRDTVEFKGDLYLDMLNIKAAKGAVLLTNGYDFVAYENFDTSFYEQYYPEGNVTIYAAPLSVAPGKGIGKGSISLANGVYDRVTAGAHDDKEANGTSVIVSGGTYEKLVAGSDGKGTTTGNPSLTVKGKAVAKQVFAGSNGGRVTGNVTVKIDGGNIENLNIGTASGASIDGNLAVIVSGGSIGKVHFVNDGTLSGKTVLIGAGEASDFFRDAKADYVFEVTAGSVCPVWNGKELSGFTVADSNGLAADIIKLDGTEMHGANGFYVIPEGRHTIEAMGRTLELQKEASFITGYDDGTFRPQNNMTRAEAVTITARLLADEDYIKKCTASYGDVAPDAWYSPYIGFMQTLNMLSPIARDNGRAFAPDEKITRGEFTQLVYSVYSGKDPENSDRIKMRTLSDVNNNTQYAAAIYGAVDAGLIAGYDDGTFRPIGNITRAEVVTMINRLLNRVPTGNTDGKTFSDVETHWARAQVLAACGKENVEWTEKNDNFSFVLKGSTPEEYIKGLYEQSSSLNGEEIGKAVDVVSEKMKQRVLNSENDLDLSAYKTTYYISEKHGNDDNDGLSPEKPFKTIERLTSIRFLRNANILLERGGVYRGTVTVMQNVNYGAYGEGPKPVWVQSKRNYADPSLWVETEYPNVWKCTELLTNVGVIGFDHDLFCSSDETYNEKYGIIRNYNTDGFMGLQSMYKDLQFFSDLREAGLKSPAPLYLYSTEGNPGSRFKSIEIGERVNILGGEPQNCRVDNISFKFTGAHAIGVYNARNLRVINCIFSWLGGSVLYFNENGSSTCYGNGVETTTCDGYFVENCWFYQVYDTGVTHQCSTGTNDRAQKNIRYLGNLIEYCHWGIEFYNAPYRDGSSFIVTTSDVHIAYNVVRNTGYGWGSVSKNRAERSQGYCCHSLSDNFDELTEYNIFDRSAGQLLNLPTNAKEVQKRNLYIQYEGGRLGDLRGTVTECNTDFAENIRKNWGDKEAVVVMIRKKD